MRSFLFSWLTLLPGPAAYALIFLGILFEGDIVLFTSFFLSAGGLLNPLLVAITTYLGVLLRDMILYRIGAHVTERSEKFRAWANRVADPFDDHLEDRPLHTVLLSKFVYGLHFAIIFRAGSIGIPISKLVKIDLIATSVWMLMVGIMGFAAGSSYGLIKGAMRSVEIALLIGLLVLLLVHRLVASYSKKKLK